MYKLKRHTINWKKGAGEFIGFTITSIMLIFLFILIISFMIIQDTNQALDTASSMIARDIIVCTSMDDARAKANERARILLADQNAIRDETIRAEVNYAAGSNAEWSKGNFIEVTVMGYVSTCEPFTSGNRSSTTIMMIERNGG